MGHLKFVAFVFIMSFLSTVSAAENELIPEDFKEYAQLQELILTNCKSRNFSEALTAGEAWLKKYPDSSYAVTVKADVERVKTVEAVFAKLSSCDPQKLINTTLKIGTASTTISDYKNGTLTLKVALSGTAAKKEVMTLEKLPSLSIYALLSKTFPDTYLLDTAAVLLSDQNYKLSQSMLLKIKKSGTDIQFHADWFKDWYSSQVFAGHYKICAEAAELLKNGEISPATAKLDLLEKSIQKNEALKPLFTGIIDRMKNYMEEAEEKARAKELAAYLEFPVKPGQQTKVTCLNFAKFKYDVYLPSSYDHKGKTFLPILYTFSPGGGGMVGHFKKVAEEMQIIVIGNLESKNGTSLDLIFDSFYAMVKDVRSRIHFDPTAQFASGMSGGGSMAYVFTRRNAPHISGVFAMGGWLGGDHDPRNHWYVEDLLVTRAQGNNDGGAKTWLGRDAAFMKSFKVNIKDWEFPGGHVSAPPEIQRPALKWMLDNRKTQSESDHKQAREFFKQCENYLGTGNTAKAFEESMTALMTMPRTWKALMAQKIVDKIMSMPTESLAGTFKKINDLPGKDQLLDYFAFECRGAGLAGDKNVTHSSFECLKAHKNGFKDWFQTATWPLAASPFPELRKPKVIIDIIEKVKVKNTYEKICLGCAYAVDGQKDKAGEILESLEKKLSDADKKGFSSSLETFKKLVN